MPFCVVYLMQMGGCGGGKRPHTEAVKAGRKKRERRRLKKVTERKTADCCGAQLTRWPVAGPFRCGSLLTNVAFRLHRRGDACPCSFRQTRIRDRERGGWSKRVYKCSSNHAPQGQNNGKDPPGSFLARSMRRLRADETAGERHLL